VFARYFVTRAERLPPPRCLRRFGLKTSENLYQFLPPLYGSVHDVDSTKRKALRGPAALPYKEIE